MSFTESQSDTGWYSQVEQQHGSDGQGSGGSAQVEGDPQAATVAAMQNAQRSSSNDNGQGQPRQGQGQPQNQRGGAQNDFLSSILEQVDPAHRPIVEPYLGKWNAGVSRRFQELHGELAPFKELGADPQTLQQAYQLYQMIDSDPQGVMNLLQEALSELGVDPGGAGSPQGQGNPQTQMGQPAQQSAIPPEFEQRLSTYEKVLEQLAQHYLGEQTKQTEQQEDAALDQYLGHLKQEFGDFDEDYVLAKMNAGKSGEEAVRAYHAAIQGQVNQRSRMPNVGPVLGGGGAIPQEGKSITDASPKETKALVAQILAASNG